MNFVTARVVPTTDKQTNTSGAGTAATITHAAPGTDYRNVVSFLTWSYSAAPAGGRLTITDGGTTVVDFDVTAAGPGQLALPMPFGKNAAVVITLAAGGGAIIAKLSSHAYKDFVAQNVATS